jgi:D-glycero-alpha-D-manno-heptose-7-phosphate kinase
MVFAYVGGDRVFSHILEKQVANYRDKNSSAVEAMDELKALAYRLKDALLLNDLNQFGELLHEAWQAKKNMAEGISNATIDDLYRLARSHGAIGGKITGAGGGGFMFFFCDPFRRHELQEALREAGVALVSLSFVEHGAEAWTVE